jgi:pyruvate kinase
MSNPYFAKLQDNTACKLRKCKIISTLGYHHNTYEAIMPLVDAGTDAFRLPIPNDSNTLENLTSMVKVIRDITAETGKPLPIIASFHNLDFGIDSGDSGTRLVEEKDYVYISLGDVRTRKSHYRMTDLDVFHNINKHDLIVVDYGKLVLDVVKVAKRGRINSSESFAGFAHSGSYDEFPETNLVNTAPTSQTKLLDLRSKTECFESESM